MLWPSDEQLVQRDTDLPGLRLLLDEDALLPLLRSSLPGPALRSLKARYIRYKPRTSCLIAYELDLPDGPASIYAKTYRAGDLSKLAKRSDRSTCTAILPEHAVILHAFPADHELPSLQCLASPQSRRTMLARLLPDQPHLWDAQIRTLAYKPERRYVGQLFLDGEPQAVLRMVLPEAFERASASVKVLGSRESRLFAPRLGRSSHHNAVALEWLPGRPLETALLDAAAQELGGVGTALARLHSLRSRRLPPLTPQLHAEALTQASDMIAWLCPSLSPAVAELWQCITPLLAVDHTPVLVHGDLHPRQILLRPDGVALIDLDEAARADPAFDLGTLLASLHAQAMMESWPESRLPVVWEAILHGYRDQRAGVSERSVLIHAAAGLVRLASQPFRNRRSDWRELAGSFLQQALRIAHRLSQHRTSTVLAAAGVSDPFDVAADAKMPFLGEALDPARMQQHLRQCLPHWPDLRLHGIHVRRHKPGRRCLIEYDVECEGRHRLIAKASAKGADERTFRLVQSLHQNGFGPGAADGIVVPEPLALLPALNAWLQRKMPGTRATDLLAGPHGVELASRIAEADFKLQTLGPAPRKHHTMADELRILHERLAVVAQMHERWTGVIGRILDACDRLAAATPQPSPCPIHRDFYADQILVDGPRLHLLDLDLYCLGDPGLDIGNFSAHMTEYALRCLGDSNALAERRQSLIDRFLSMRGPQVRSSVKAYETLTLVRHIAISTQFADRHRFTEPLIGLCAQHLSL